MADAPPYLGAFTRTIPQEKVRDCCPGYPSSAAFHDG